MHRDGAFWVLVMNGVDGRQPSGQGGGKSESRRGLDRPVPHAQKISPVEKNVKGRSDPLARLQPAPVLGLPDL